MIRCINDGCIFGLKPVAKRQRRMIQVAGPDRDVSDPKSAFDQLMVSDLRAEFVQLNWEVGILHLTFESVAQRLTHAFGSVQVPRVARGEEGSKEGYALDVVPVRMADTCPPSGAGRVATRCCPSSRMPVPQSMIMSAPPGVVISTHEVLPP